MGHDFTDADLRAMIAEVREVNTALGWRQGGNTVDDYIALLHSEIGEATDAYRRWRLADATYRVAPPYTPNDFPKGTPLPPPIKPEGVGSEFADLFIRLLDHGDSLGLNGWTELAHSVVPEPPIRSLRPPMTSFGRQIAWLHHLVDDAYIAMLTCGLRPGGYDLDSMVAWLHIHDELRRACAAFGIDMAAEYRRKIDYNRTREYQHGGRTLNEGGPVTGKGGQPLGPIAEVGYVHPDSGAVRAVSAGPHAVPAGEGAKRRKYAEPGIYNDYP